MQHSHYGHASLYSGTGLRKYLTRDERARFLAASLAVQRSDLRTLCLTLAYTGCRISEALALTAASVQAAEGIVAIRTLKKRNGLVVVREVPIPPLLIAEFERVHGLSSSHPLQRLWPLSRGRAWQLVKEVMAEAGIQAGIHATPKGLRHGFGLHAIRCGIPINLVQRWLGHASMTTTAIYLQAVGAEEREIAARMWI
ncbi:site-specific integrase [Hyphomicrobium sp.]|uniref:tyrosine-type recombinase/integrase n=1 Tax=Hyphomicrobium sp. TaxID=82 RepID=UPI0025BD0526|nr:site-specific integrase [Hyphomicrobium sp.]MCC7250459.1 site-specific integrase [Hyphomicrobium sp.]